MRILTAFVLLVLAAALPVSASAQQSLVRLTYGSGWDALPAIVAIERGFFAQEGLIVSGMPVSSAGAVIESLATGSSDFAVMPQRTLLVMAAAEVEGSIVAMNGWGAEIQLVAPSGSGISGPADLRGKTIAIGVGSEAFPALIRVLNQAELAPSDVTIQEMNSRDVVGALENGTADAVFDLRYFTTAIVQRGAGEIVMSNEDVINTIGRIGADPLVAASSVMENEPETVQRVANAWVAALRYIESDPEDAARLLMIFFHRQGVKVEKDLAMSWVGMKKYNRYTWTDADVTDAEYNGWALRAGGILKVEPSLDGYVDNSFAQAAASQGQ